MREEIFNIWRKKHITCIDGEEFCESCHGLGGFEIDGNTVDICEDCRGMGKHDWISKAVKPDIPYLISKTKIRPLEHEIKESMNIKNKSQTNS